MSSHPLHPHCPSGSCSHQPTDPDAHLLLAESAQKLNKRDEAIAEYNATLKLDASEDQIKTARKALTRLQ